MSRQLTPAQRRVIAAKKEKEKAKVAWSILEQAYKDKKQVKSENKEEKK